MPKDLSDLPLLAALPPEALAELLRGALAEIPVGDYLFCQGEPGDQAWIVLSGVLLVEHTHPLAAEPVVLGLCSRGELLGEVGLLQGGARTASGRALTDLQVITLDQARFDQLLRDHSGFGRALATVLASRLASTNKRLPGGPARIVALVGVPPSAAEGLAAALARQTDRLVAVTGWPDARGLPRRMGVEASGRSTLLHPRGFHVLVHRSPPEAAALDQLLDSLRQRYAYALVCLDGWEGGLDQRLTEDEPVLVYAGLPDPPCRQPILRLGQDPRADLPLPPVGRPEHFDRAMADLALRVQRNLTLTLRWPAAPDAGEQGVVNALLERALGPHCARWSADALELQAWLSNEELADALDALLVPIAERCPRATLRVQGQELRYTVPEAT